MPGYFLFPPLLIALLLPAASFAWKSEYREGQALVEASAYSQAIEEFEAALVHPKLRDRDRGKVEAALADARARAAAQAYARGESLAARGEVVGALNAFSKAMALEPGNARYAERFETEKSNYDGRLSQVRELRAAAQENGDYGAAIAKLQGLADKSRDPQLYAALDGLRAEAARFYTQQSDTRLKAGRYDTAYEAMARAADYADNAQLTRRANARKHLHLSNQALLAGNYSTAYNELDRALQLEPDNDAMRAFEEKFIAQRAGVLYNEASAARGAGNLALARQHLSTLVKLKPGYADAEEQLFAVNQGIASTYHARAEELIGNREREHYGRALAYYLLAAEQKQALFPDLSGKIDEAKRLLNQELEFRVLLQVNNHSAEPGAQGVVRDQILAAMRNNPKLKKLKVLERDALDDILTEQGLGQAFLDPQTAVQVKKLKGVQAGLYVDVVKLEAFETGADTPRYGNQEYQNGTRWVPNQRYSELQGEVSRAQRDLLQAQTDHNQALAEQNRAMQQAQNSAQDNVWARAAGALAVVGGSLSQKNLSDAEDYLNRVQSELSYADPQIEEPVYANFRYKIFDLTLRGEAVLSYRVVNFTTSEVSDAQSVTVSDSARDVYIPGDPGKGVMDDPKTLPSVEEFRNRLLKSGNQQLIARLAGQFDNLASSYFQLAQSAAKEGLEDTAVENYVRYLYSAPDLSAPQVQVANQYIYDQLGLSLLRRN